MLSIREHDYLQKLALEYRLLQSRWTQWHSYRWMAAYIGGGLGLWAISSVVLRTDSEFGATLAVIIAIGCGYYYWAVPRSLQRQREIRDTFARYNAQLSHDGSIIRVNDRYADPLSNDAALATNLCAHSTCLYLTRYGNENFYAADTVQ